MPPKRQQPTAQNPFTETPAATPPEPSGDQDSGETSGPGLTIGRWVHYRLSEFDAQEIEKRRKSARARTKYTDGWPRANEAREGQEYPALVVATFGGTAVNLRVQLDGEDEYWATSRSEGDNAGHWHWPERV